MSLLTEDIKKFRAITDGFLVESEDTPEPTEEPVDAEETEEPEVKDETSEEEVTESEEDETISSNPYKYYGSE